MRENNGINSSLEVFGTRNEVGIYNYINNSFKNNIKDFWKKDFIQGTLAWGIYEGNNIEEKVWKIQENNNPIFYWE